MSHSRGGDQAAARTNFEATLIVFEAAVQQAPANALRHANLGLLYAFMGRKEEAIREGQRAVELMPESKDAVFGPWMTGYLAMIYARGRRNRFSPAIARAPPGVARPG